MQLRDERVRAVGEITVELPHFLAVAVQHDDGGKSKNFILLGQLNVLLFFLCGLGFFARKIELHQNEIVVRVIFELRLRGEIIEGFSLHHLRCSCGPAQERYNAPPGTAIVFPSLQKPDAATPGYRRKILI